LLSCHVIASFSSRFTLCLMVIASVTRELYLRKDHKPCLAATGACHNHKGQPCKIEAAGKQNARKDSLPHWTLATLDTNLAVSSKLVQFGERCISGTKQNEEHTDQKRLQSSLQMTQSENVYPNASTCCLTHRLNSSCKLRPLRRLYDFNGLGQLVFCERRCGSTEACR